MLTLNNLNVIVSDFEILNNLSVTLLPGAIINLHGSNGIGKTSLLRKLATLEYVEKGQLFYNEIDIKNALSEYRALISYVGHENALMENKTVLDNLSFWAEAYNISEALGAAVKCFGLDKYILFPVKNLSKGWKRKVSLARLLLSYSPIWVIDEPFANLDVEAKNNFINILKGKANQRGIIIFTSHEKINDADVINYNLEKIKLSEIALKNSPTNLRMLKLISYNELSNYSVILTNSFFSLLFYLLVIIVFGITLKSESITKESSIAIHFSSIALAVLLGSKKMFREEIENGFLDQLKLTGVSEILIYGSKSILNSLISALLFLVAFPVSILLLNIGENLLSFIFSSFIFFISASFIVYLVSLLGHANEKIDFLLPILSIPFLIPLIIISILGISTINFLMLNISLMLFFGLFCSFLGSKII